MAAPDTVENAPKEEVLFSWVSPARTFKRRSRQYYVTALAIASIIGFILFIAEGAMPVILLAALIFLFYILNSVPPQEAEYKLTNLGVKIDTKRTEWEFFSRFWFNDRFDNRLLILDMPGVIGRMELIIDRKDENDIRKIVAKHLIEEKAPPTFFDTIVNWFSSKMPAE